MKLNWRKIACIVLGAELLLIYWHGMTAIPFKKQQQHVHPIATPKPSLPLTKVERALSWQVQLNS